MKFGTHEPEDISESIAPAVRKATERHGGFSAVRRRLGSFIIFAAVLLIAFCRPLWHLISFARHSELYSYILLVPFISAYLVWTKRREPVPESRPNRRFALIPFLGGVLVMVFYGLALRNDWNLAEADSLAIFAAGVLCLLFGGLFFFAEVQYLKSIAFPLVFLFFSVPFPEVLRHTVERFFQVGSARVAYCMLTAAGMPVLKTGTHFQLPGISIEVAPECSGIHSSVVLLITSLLAAYLFLKKPSCRWLFALSTIPLALLRNGFRIFTISQLCVHIGPQMINSPIHHRGGPLFFVLSMGPLLLLLSYLVRHEKAN